jgi:D-glycero-alpha-D-manno-heptose-7-phosphate kinase
VGLLLALATLRYGVKDIKRDVLAQRAIELERVRLLEPGGHQDQVFAAYGGFNRIDFDRHGWRVRPLGDPSALLAHCLLFYTGQQRTASQLEGLKVERLEANLIRLNYLRNQVDAAERCLAAGDYRSLGALLHEAWEVKRRLAPGVSYPELDNLYASVRAAGAWGGKLLGAGGGGFLLVMASPDRFSAIRQALTGLLEIPNGWSSSGASVYTLNGVY